MKRICYIFLFALLGLLVSFLLHMLLEIAALSLILNNFQRYATAPIWIYWHELHTTMSLLLTIVGVTSGYLAGKHFWPILYPNKE